MIKGLRLGAWIFIFVTFVSCSKFKYKIDEPSYIYIPSYDVLYETMYANGGPGTTHHKFTDINVVVDQSDLGIYPIPCKVPITTAGVHTISLKPIIKVNGVSSVRTEYSVMGAFDSTLNFEASKQTSVIPVFDYYSSGIFFYWVEDFEFSGSSLVGDTAIKVQTTEKFEGQKAAKIELRNGQNKCIAYSSSLFALPTNSELIYLEVNYKCNQPFKVGLQNANYSEEREVGGANASDEWNKIYFFLTPAASGLPTSSSYYVYFKFEKDNSTGSENPLLFLDNIKVVAKI